MSPTVYYCYFLLILLLIIFHLCLMLDFHIILYEVRHSKICFQLSLSIASVFKAQCCEILFNTLSPCLPWLMTWYFHPYSSPSCPSTSSPLKCPNHLNFLTLRASLTSINGHHLATSSLGIPSLLVIPAIYLSILQSHQPRHPAASLSKPIHHNYTVILISSSFFLKQKAGPV